MSKTIVVTGAGSGLGRAIARNQAAHGDTVILLGRTESKLKAVADELGAPAEAIVCDVGSIASVTDAFAAIQEKYSRIDVLINNAGLFKPFLLAEASDTDINSLMQTNFAGPIYCSRAAIPLLGSGGHIINVSSQSVATNHAMFALYQSTKAGLERFTTALRQEMEGAGVRVTMVRAGSMQDEDFGWDLTPEVARQFHEENQKRGVRLGGTGMSEFSSVAPVFRALIDLPPDLNVSEIMLEARRTQ